MYEDWFRKQPFWHNNQGRNPKEAKAHFFALRAATTGLSGYLLLDGDNRSLPDRELASEGLVIGRWHRYEVESYLVHPTALNRFLAPQVGALWLSQADSSLADELPPAVYRTPLADHDYLTSTPASKTILPKYFEAAELKLPKNEYYRIAEQMLPEEIPAEIREKLDQLADVLL